VQGRAVHPNQHRLFALNSRVYACSGEENQPHWRLKSFQEGFEIFQINLSNGEPSYSLPLFVRGIWPFIMVMPALSGCCARSRLASTFPPLSPAASPAQPQPCSTLYWGGLVGGFASGSPWGRRVAARAGGPSSTRSLGCWLAFEPPWSSASWRERREKSAPLSGALQMFAGFCVLPFPLAAAGGFPASPGAPGPLTPSGFSRAAALLGSSVCRHGAVPGAWCRHKPQPLQQEQIALGTRFCAAARVSAVQSDIPGIRARRWAKNYIRVLLKKEKREYKKPQKTLWRNFCFGIPTCCLSGACQQLTSSKWNGQTLSRSSAVTPLRQPERKLQSTNLGAAPFPAPAAVGSPGEGPASTHPVSSPRASLALEAAILSVRARPGHGRFILQLRKAHGASHCSQVPRGDFGEPKLWGFWGRFCLSL